MGEDAGSPATYGRTLATFLARQSLVAADPVRFRGAIERADLWLAGRELHTITDAAVALMAIAAAPSLSTAERKERSIMLCAAASRTTAAGDLLRPRLQSRSTPHWSSWPWPGPGTLPKSAACVALGRAFLVAQQRADGSWTETTRPAGDVSYAQRISTSGWAVLALLETREQPKRSGRDPKR